MSEKPRILILTTAYLPLIGGSELAIKHITDRIKNAVFDLVTARYDKRMPVSEQMGNVHVFRAGGRFGQLSIILPKIFLPLALFFAARKLMRRHRYALVHVFQASQAGGAGWLLKRVYPDLPLIVTLQEGKALDAQLWLVRFLRGVIISSADALTVISTYLDRYARTINDSSPVYLIPNGVDVEKFAAEAKVWRERIRSELKAGRDKRIILTVSRLVEKNGVQNLLIAAKKVLSSHNIKLVIIGDGPLMGRLKKMSHDLNMDEHVLFTGTVTYEDLPRYLGAADVFVRPSLSEGLGTAFLEAMACGVPVVASPVGGIPDFITDGETGFFCNPRDPGRIADSIIKVLGNSDAANVVVKRAFELVRTKYNWDMIAESMSGVYSKFLFNRQ